MAAGAGVILTFFGNDGPLQGTIRNVNRGVATVGKGLGVLAATGAASGLAVAGVLAGIPLAIAGIGVAAAAQNEQVKSSFTDLKNHVVSEVTAMSEPLVPVLTGIADKATATFDRISPALENMIARSAPIVDKLASSVLGFVEKIFPAIERAFTAAEPIIKVLGEGIVALGDGVAGFIDGLTAGAPGAALALGAIFDVVNMLLPFVGQLVGVLAQQLGPVFAALVPIIQPLLNLLTSILVPVLQTLGPIVLSVVQALAAALVPALQTAQAGFASIMPLLTPIIQQLGTFLVDAINQLAPLLPPLSQAFFAIVGALLPLIPPLIRISTAVMPIFIGVLHLLTAIITGVVVPVISFLAQHLLTFLNTTADVAQGVGRWFSTIPGFVSSAARQVGDWLNRMIAWFRDLPGMVSRAVGNLGNLLVNAGRDILSGLWRGIQSMAGWLRSNVQNFFGSLVPDWARSSLGIGSPSKVFADKVGQWIPAGAAVGITDNMGAVQGAVNGMADVALPIPSTPNASGGVGAMTVRFEGNTSDALAIVIMQMIRTGKIQIQGVNV